VLPVCAVDGQGKQLNIKIYFSNEYGRDKKCMQNYDSKTQKGRDRFKDLSVVSRIILKRLEIGCEGVDWFHVAQYRNQ
jgi:hypothetical protein